MTGYGRFRLSKDGREITVEVKSVNHRFLDISSKLPRNLSFLDDSLRKEIAEQLSRGHVDVFVNYSNMRDDAKEVRIDLPLALSYLKTVRELKETADVPGELSVTDFIRLPDVLSIIEAEEDQQAVRELFVSAIRGALTSLVKMRRDEGEHLKKDILDKLNRITQIRESISKRAPEIVKGYQEKLAQRLAKLVDGQIDESRFITEVAIFADRAAIDEELVRLESHVLQVRNTVGENNPVGKKLDFLVQEMNREFNTIGSKAMDAEIAQLVVEAKGEIEKLREQVQNVE
ncbi:MAG: YicC family protein [Clostridia bacterium]|nr:YicC family protein [Clostridia bacterium]